MGKILGRTDDMLIIRGINVFPSQIEGVLMSFGAEIAPVYQIVADRANNQDSIEVCIEMPDKFDLDVIKNIEAVRARIEKKLFDVLGLHIKVRICEHMSLKRSEGKAVRVVDKRQ